MEGHQMLRHTAIIGLALVGAVCAANAADLPRAMPVKAPPPLPLFTWNGFYIGVSAGGKWADIDHTVTSGATTFTFNDSRASSWLAGGQIGYNWQTGQFVFGLETDLQASAADDTFAPYKFSNPWFGTLRGRAGFAINNILLYGTLGIAYGELKGEFFNLEEDKTLFGWTAGAGMEVGFAPNWSAKVEYLYMDLGSRSFSITGNDNGLQASYLRLGVNYHF
jgi:outer membrane immunogenic protein